MMAVKMYILILQLGNNFGQSVSDLLLPGRVDEDDHERCAVDDAHLVGLHFVNM